MTLIARGSIIGRWTLLYVCYLVLAILVFGCVGSSVGFDGSSVGFDGLSVGFDGSSVGGYAVWSVGRPTTAVSDPCPQ